MPPKRKAATSPLEVDNMQDLVSDRARQLLTPAKKKHYWEVTDIDFKNFTEDCLSKYVSIDRRDEIANWLRHDPEISLPYARAMLGDYTTILKGNYQAKKLSQPRLKMVKVTLRGVEPGFRERMQIATKKMMTTKRKVALPIVNVKLRGVESDLRENAVEVSSKILFIIADLLSIQR